MLHFASGMPPKTHSVLSYAHFTAEAEGAKDQPQLTRSLNLRCGDSCAELSFHMSLIYEIIYYMKHILPQTPQGNGDKKRTRDEK